MLFYRGIAVPAADAAETIDDICRHGLVTMADQRTMAADYLKPRLDELWKLPVLTRNETLIGDGTSWVCACADEASAMFYACHNNRTAQHDTPLLITFEADLADIVVDATDFLFTLFQLGEPTRARPWAERLFGNTIHRYLDRAYAIKDGLERIPICHIAVQDHSIINSHAANRIVIAGRWRTRFCTAFIVRIPVAAQRIVGVRVIDGEYELPDAEVTLQMVC